MTTVYTVAICICGFVKALYAHFLSFRLYEMPICKVYSVFELLCEYQHSRLQIVYDPCRIFACALFTYQGQYALCMTNGYHSCGHGFITMDIILLIQRTTNGYDE